MEALAHAVPERGPLVVADGPLAAEGEQDQSCNQEELPSHHHDTLYELGCPNGKCVHHAHAFAASPLCRSLPAMTEIGSCPIPAAIAIPILYRASGVGDAKHVSTSLVALAVVLLAHTLQEVQRVSDAGGCPTRITLARLGELVELAMFAMLPIRCPRLDQGEERHGAEPRHHGEPRLGGQMEVSWRWHCERLSQWPLSQNGS
mmetsp:Transcript_34092/g.77138  ORF Transcript_34092/g.77138 Transcript_34092/m.77138 type:complete len:203 (-) Transcript_34092:3-611(-)